MDSASDLFTQNNTLEHLGVDECCVVVGFSEDLPSEQRQRLEELGFCPGALLKCMKNTPFGGPRIFEVGGSVFSIESSLAKHLKVKCDHG
jgi:Fe2+ transport system protein FeoA